MNRRRRRKVGWRVKVGMKEEGRNEGGREE
jgi:hypothetical protein